MRGIYHRHILRYVTGIFLLVLLCAEAKKPLCLTAQQRDSLPPQKAVRPKITGSDTLPVKTCPDFTISGSGSSKNWSRIPWTPIPQRDARESLLDTKIKIAYSATGLYFLFFCADRQLTATMTADFLNLWNEDVAEVFLWTDESTSQYFEYEISPLNHELILLISNEKGDIVRWQPFLYEQDRRTAHATSVQGGKKQPHANIKSWMAECYIPYKLLRPLKNNIPRPGMRWRANVYRMDYDLGKDPVNWSWRQTRLGAHDYEKFGTLLFE